MSLITSVISVLLRAWPLLIGWKNYPTSTSANKLPLDISWWETITIWRKWGWEEEALLWGGAEWWRAVKPSTTLQIISQLHFGNNHRNTVFSGRVCADAEGCGGQIRTIWHVEYITCQLNGTVNLKHLALIPVPNPWQWLNFLEESNKEGSLPDDEEPAWSRFGQGRNVAN